MTPDWEHYRAFLAVLERGSLSGAARALRSTQPTMGRQIEALETALGVALFTRSPGGLAPTETALALRPHAQAMAVAAEALLRTASAEADAVRGVIRVTASDIVGVEVLPPILAAFQAAWPQVIIELALSNRQEDLLRRDADIAVRMARPAQGALVARHIGAVGLGLYATRDYLLARGVPKTLSDEGQIAVGFDRDPQTPRALQAAGIPLTRETLQFRTDSDLAQLAAVRAGGGIGAVQHRIAERDPSLVPVLEQDFALSLPIWVAMHEDLRGLRRMRLLFDHLAEGLGRYVRGKG